MDMKIALPVILCLFAWTACEKSADKGKGGESSQASHAHAKDKGSGDGHAHGNPSVAAAQAEKCPHDALKADCFICDPALRDKGRLWCREHDRYEDRCFLCHPEIEEKDRPFCAKHSLYEDECFLCRPESEKGGKTGSETRSEVESKAIKAAAMAPGLLCGEHRVLESECGICHPELLAGLGMGGGLKVRLASTESARKGGIETGKPETDDSEGGPAFLSRVTYNQNQFAHITSLATGIIQKVHVDIGAQVRKGQALVEIASPEISRAKSAYLSALSELHLKELAYQREKGLADKNATSRQEFEQAEAEFRKARNESSSARQELLDFGMSESDLSVLVKTHATNSTLLIRAPFSGTVIERKAVTGEAVNQEGPMFAVADLSKMWLELSIPSDAGAGLKVGDPVAASFDALPGVRFPGRLDWISSGIDGTTRMLKARAIVENPKGILKDGMFGKVRIPTAKSGARLGLPSEAIQHIDGGDYVFVKLEEDLYEIRKVWLEEGMEGKVTLLDGIAPGENVVLAGSFVMKTEFLKSRLGAGCTDGH